MNKKFGLTAIDLETILSVLKKHKLLIPMHLDHAKKQAKS